MTIRDNAHIVSVAEFLCHNSMELTTDILLTVVESSYDGIYVTDNNANTILVNHSYERISGLKRADMLGRNMHDLVKDGIISRSGTLAAIEHRKPITLEQVFRTGNHAVITSTPIYDKRDKLIMVITNVRDITEFRALEKKLQGSEEQNRRWIREIRELRQQAGLVRKPIATDPASQKLLMTVNHVAGRDVPILLIGERGIGKREMAQYIVSRSSRQDAHYSVVDCSTDAATLEWVLFGSSPEGGYPPGNREPGVLEQLAGGTVLLDEVGYLPLRLQERLIAYIKGDNVGEGAPAVRILASTSQEMRELVRSDRFREDLFYLLSVVPVRLPPLRERKEDIIPLAESCMLELNRKYRQRKRLSQEAQLCLKAYHWPGNIRELRNMLEQSVLLCPRNVVGQDDLPICTKAETVSEKPSLEPHPVDLKRKLNSLELFYIRQAYQQYGNVRDAAKGLGMEPSTFVRRRKKLEESV